MPKTLQTLKNKRKRYRNKKKLHLKLGKSCEQHVYTKTLNAHEKTAKESQTEYCNKGSLSTTVDCADPNILVSDNLALDTCTSIQEETGKKIPGTT